MIALENVQMCNTWSGAVFSRLCTDLRFISVQHHEAKFLRADAGEVDIEGVTGGHDAVEERQPLLAGVARTPAVILRTWTQRHTTESQTHSLCFELISERSFVL